MFKPLMLAGAAALLTTACVQAQDGPTTTFDGLAGSRNVDTDGNVEMNGAAVDVDAEVGGDLEANGGAVDIRGSVDGESLVNGGAVSLRGDFGGMVVANGGAIDLDGTFESGFRINTGNLEFNGEANSPIEVAGQGNNRSMFGRERADRSEIEINGILAAGGQLCAHEVTFGSRAVVNGPLTVIADDEPRYASGFDSSQITFENRDGSRCDEV